MKYVLVSKKRPFWDYQKKIKCLWAVVFKIWPFKSVPQEELGPLNFIKSDLTGKVIKIFAWNFQFRCLLWGSRCHKNFKFVDWKIKILKIKYCKLERVWISRVKISCVHSFKRIDLKNCIQLVSVNTYMWKNNWFL